MELVFDDRKLLLPGVHDVSIETVKEYFGPFQRSDRRFGWPEDTPKGAVRVFI